jgi:shikimate kinase
MGMPGCGKSSIARKLSSRLNIPFLDLDNEIENELQLSVSEIFATKGEVFFREVESEILLRMIGKYKNGLVLACGGGTPCYNDNLSIIKKNGIGVYLNATPEFLLSRIELSDERPMFVNLSKDEKLIKLRHLLSKREKYYLECDIKVEALDVDVDALSEAIKNYTKDSQI